MNAARLTLAALIASGCASLDPSAAPDAAAVASVNLPTLSIEATHEVAAEGEGAGFRVRRDSAGDALTLRLRLEGDATSGADYALTDVDAFDGALATATIRAGETSLELRLDVLDDVPAEAAESLTLILEPGSAYRIDADADRATIAIPPNDFTVTTTRDDGPGSLRQAIRNAIAAEGQETVTFDSVDGPFGAPQRIELTSPLPQLQGELAIDGRIEDRLWQASGVSVSGARQHRVFDVAPGARAEIRNITIAEGVASQGGGIVNRGTLIVQGVSFLANEAMQVGGGVANLGGTLKLINSTFAYNAAGQSGGGLAVLDGDAVVTNCTFNRNRAARGGGIFNAGRLLLRNTILANSPAGEDCVTTGSIHPKSTHNLMEAGYRCGVPLSYANPRLQPLGFYNGPTPTLPIGGGSLAINLGDNDSAIDANGDRLVWDQRGNGDPRFVAGFTDVGAFEHQRLPVLVVDTAEDGAFGRGCTPAGAVDCSLRGAIELVNADQRTSEHVIRFDARVFASPQVIELQRPLPELTTDVTLDASDTGGVTIRGRSRIAVLPAARGFQVKLVGVTVDGVRSSGAAPSSAGR